MCFLNSVFQMEAYTSKLKEMETLFSDMDGGLKPANSAEMEAALRATRELVDDLQDDTELLAGKTIQRLIKMLRSEILFSIIS